MMRNALAVVVGLIAMIVFVMATFMTVALTMFDKLLVEGSYEAKPLWSIASLGLGLIGAIIGGVVCKAIARNAKAPALLIIVLLVLSGVTIASRLMMSQGEAPPPRTADMPCSEVMPYVKEPVFVSILNPIVGVIGVLLGASMIRGKGSASSN